MNSGWRRALSNFALIFMVAGCASDAEMQQRRAAMAEEMVHVRARRAELGRALIEPGTLLTVGIVAACVARGGCAMAPGPGYRPRQAQTPQAPPQPAQQRQLVCYPNPVIDPAVPPTYVCR